MLLLTFSLYIYDHRIFRGLIVRTPAEENYTLIEVTQGKERQDQVAQECHGACKSTVCSISQQ